MKIRRTPNETKFLKSIGSAIRTFRLERKLTQEDLGELADVNPKYIGELERGEKNPTVIILNRLAVAGDINLCDFFVAERKELDGF